MTAPAANRMPRPGSADASREAPMEPQALTSTPDRSIAQRMQALAHGNDVRLKRAQFKRDLKAGRVSIIDAINAPPPWLEEAKLYDLLLAVPRYGRVRVNKVFKIVGISPVKRVAGISARQRADLLVVLGGGSIPSRAGSVPSRAQIVHSLPEPPCRSPRPFSGACSRPPSWTTARSTTATSSPSRTR
jgi:hypothetical protein